jgi:anti-sigma B factor antagonist
MSTPLTIESRREGEGAAVLTLAGEVDVSNVAEVREAALKLLEDGIKRLVFDLSGVTYMDSSGLGMLVGLLKRVRESKGEVAIAGATARVSRLFDITGLKQIFSLYEDASAALKEVR